MSTLLTDRLPGQLQDLLAWADYIVDALHRDQPHDPGRVQRLRELLGDEALRDLRFQAWGLRERLDRARVLSEIQPVTSRSTS